MNDSPRHTPVLSDMLVRESAAAFVARADANSRILLLRAQPRWSGEPTLTIGDSQVRIAAGFSPLAILDAYSTLPDNEFLLVLTDRSDQELGSAVLIPAERQTVQFINEWSLVPGLFGATEMDPRLRAIGAWLPGALMQHQPAGGWPFVPAGAVTAEFAIRTLLAQCLGLPAEEELDAMMLLEQLDNVGARRRWIDLDEAVRIGLTAAASRYLGDYTALVLTAVASGKAVSVVAIGLAADVLWPSVAIGVEPPEQIAARTRIELYIGTGITRASARGYAEAAISIVLRRDTSGDPRTEQVTIQAEALLGDLGWAAGADRSTILPAGFRSRLRFLADQLSTQFTASVQVGSSAIEDSLASVTAHLMSHRYEDELFAGQMAVRLMRWLTVGATGAPQGSLEAAMQRYITDGGWVDRALAAVWTGSSDASTAAAYAVLIAQVSALRDAQDTQAAAVLTGEFAGSGMVVPVESLLKSTIYPLSQLSPVLLIVLDGMSVAVATELVQDIGSLGWVELVREGTTHRGAALAALPSVTAYSRTSLFAGQLLAGQQDIEKARFAAAVGGALFHKDDLRSGGGVVLPGSVTTAIADPAQHIVGVVLNTIDDALAKHDPGGTRWTLAQIQHLRALLNEATKAGRTVILTSDHGHVLERGGEHRPVAGAGARWRSLESGTAMADEIAVAGSRVLAPDGVAILARKENLRYTGKAAGYHGGASLAELTIPVLVFRRQEQPALAGWVDALPQSPAWWNDRVRIAEKNPPVVAKSSTAKKRGQPDTQSLFELPSTESSPVLRTSLAQRVIASAIFAGQQARAGRHPLAPALVERILTALIENDGRVHKDTIAVTAGITTVTIEPTLAVLKRLLNVDGYDVVATDADGHTVVLDLALLREQFDLTEGA